MGSNGSLSSQLVAVRAKLESLEAAHRQLAADQDALQEQIADIGRRLQGCEDLIDQIAALPGYEKAIDLIENIRRAFRREHDSIVLARTVLDAEHLGMAHHAAQRFLAAHSSQEQPDAPSDDAWGE